MNDSYDVKLVLNVRTMSSKSKIYRNIKSLYHCSIWRLFVLWFLFRFIIFSFQYLLYEEKHACRICRSIYICAAGFTGEQCDWKISYGEWNYFWRRQSVGAILIAKNGWQTVDTHMKCTYWTHSIHLGKHTACVCCINK